MKNGKDVTILLVEDDEVDRLAFKKSFDQLKIANNIIMSGDGQDALSVLRGENGVSIPKPYIIVLDLHLPKVNGFELLEEIRQDPELCKAVIFVLTSSEDEADMINSYKNNIAGYVVKQNAGGTFLDAVRLLEHYWKVVHLPQ